MKNLIEKLKTEDIKKCSKEDISRALYLINSNLDIANESKKIKTITYSILELTKKYNLDKSDINLWNHILKKLLESNDLMSIGLWNIIKEILNQDNKINNDKLLPHIDFNTEKFSNEINFVWDINDWWKVLRVSENVENILWYDVDNFRNWEIKFVDIIHPDDLDRVSKEVEAYSKQKLKNFDQEYRLIKKNWEVITIKDKTIVKFDDNWEIKYFYWYIYDVTEQIELKNNFQESLLLDHKTWLPNQIKLFNDIESITWEKLIILIKINDFKIINSTYWYDMWDNIINIIKDKLEHVFSKFWFTLYKTNQLNFWLLKECNDINQDSKNKLLNEISRFISNFKVNTELWEINIKMSAWAVCNENATFDNALHALYSWYNSGWLTIYDKNIDENLIKNSENKIYWGNKIREWLEKWYFMPYYQWIRDNNTWEINKYEALVRYDDGNEFFTPYHFLDIAEELNLIHKISIRMVKKVIEEMKYHDKAISINLTENDFLDDNLINLIITSLKENNIPNNRLAIEVLETITKQWTDTIIKNIKKLKDIWIKTSIDDFGTWYSNFSRLLDISPEYLKIDWSLIKWVIWEDSHKYWKILRSIIEFWHNQWSKVIAEFVENKEIQDLLDVLWVDFSQWFYYSKPNRDIVNNKKES